MAQAPFIESKSRKKWHNWHKTLDVGGKVKRIFTPYNKYTDGSFPPVGKEFIPGLKALQQIIKYALRFDTKVRAHGSRWSLNNVAFSDSYLIDSRQMDFCKVGIEEDKFVTTGYKAKKEQLSFVQCGVMVRKLNEALTVKKQALITSGASDGQTLIGAISTGTHGGANQVGAMTEFVRGIHLVVPGKHVFVQRKSDQAVTKDFCAWLENAEFIVDDDLFNAALVGFGCFGLVHGLLIETEPQYLLERVIKNYDLPDVLKAITELDMSGLNLPKGDNLPFHFEVAINPYRPNKGQEGAFVRVYYKHEMQVELLAGLEGIQPELVDLHTAMAEAFDENVAQELETIAEDPSTLEGIQLDRASRTGFAVQIALKQAFKLTDDANPDIRIPAQFFTGKNSADPDSAAPLPATSLEIGVPLDQIGAAVELIIKVVAKDPFAAPLALRYVKQSTATLGFTGFSPISVTMEMPGPFGKLFFPRTGKGHQAIFDALAASNIPHRYHWGQQLPQNKKWAPKAFGNKLDNWKIQRLKLLGKEGIQMFSNDFVDTFLGGSGDRPLV